MPGRHQLARPRWSGQALGYPNGRAGCRDLGGHRRCHRGAPLGRAYQSAMTRRPASPHGSPPPSRRPAGDGYSTVLPTTLRRWCVRTPTPRRIGLSAPGRMTRHRGAGGWRVDRTGRWTANSPCRSLARIAAETRRAGRREGESAIGNARDLAHAHGRSSKPRRARGYFRRPGRQPGTTVIAWRRLSWVARRWRMRRDVYLRNGPRQH
jgi:hypothetical protein